jgi:hypothetical protein
MRRATGADIVCDESMADSPTEGSHMYAMVKLYEATSHSGLGKQRLIDGAKLITTVTGLTSNVLSLVGTPSSLFGLTVVAPSYGVLADAMFRMSDDLETREQRRSAADDLHPFQTTVYQYLHAHPGANGPGSHIHTTEFNAHSGQLEQAASLLIAVANRVHELGATSVAAMRTVTGHFGGLCLVVTASSANHMGELLDLVALDPQTQSLVTQMSAVMLQADSRVLIGRVLTA